MVVNLPLVLKLQAPALFWLGIIGLIPAAYAFIHHENSDALSFVTMSLCALVISNILRLLGRHAKSTITIRDLFIFTVSLWISATLVTALPISMILPDLNYTGAVFETASALSTTGATAINGLDGRPQAVLLWRSILQFLGGIGFVVIGVAVLPSFLMGGLNLFKTESSSFDGQAKLTPHIKTMALALLSWYLGTAVACTVCYVLSGLDIFLAVNAALCTVATGGMMPIDASMNGLPPAVHYFAIFFMFLGSLPFLVLLSTVSGNVLHIFRDQQVRGFVKMIVVISVALMFSLIVYNGYDVERAFRVALFNVVSILSTTGFALEDFTTWNPFAVYIFLIILAIGGCSGSTSGGIKIFRLQICFVMFKTQLKKTIHPHMVLEPHFNGQQLSSGLIRAVVTYLVAYILVLLFSSCVATLLGLNVTDAFTATMTSLSNVGPAMGTDLGPSANFANISGSLHLLFALDMIVGRLEILPVLLCLTRYFWRF